eukprot:TRINITY_DN79667_c0_g1_i1.p1 TRINITY_DN79667_c0_g1~~TRINITY_DN79667_c0_g1_i1.p1  ORF type:complete len:277 (+),score=41.73 TRINITY_DN79667_c0_g1_i1:69-899(+)
MKRVVVTGGNKGIGLALCKQLAQEDGCYVYLGSRNADRGNAAVASIVEASPECKGRIEMLEVDPGSDSSVAKAAAKLKDCLAPGESLYGLVNNAGTGLQHKSKADEVMNVNLYGPKRMIDAFLPLLSKTNGRIVNVGSGAGPNFVKSLNGDDRARFLCSCPPDWDSIHEFAGTEMAKPKCNAYGLSKACLAAYTQLLARLQPDITSSCITPGFIDTDIVRGYGATKPPEEGTVAIRHCLHATLDGNGWYYGSDAIRSQYHVMRNPGEPAYDGTPPF